MSDFLVFGDSGIYSESGYCLKDGFLGEIDARVWLRNELSAQNTKAGRLQRAALELLLRHELDGAIPTNGRFLFYELTQAGIVPKHYEGKARQPSHDLCDATMHLRNLGLVPWSWIVDETREVVEWSYASSAYRYVHGELDRFRLDCWDGEPPPLVICEARSTKGVLEKTTAEYLVPITATNGQSGGFIVNEIVPLLEENERRVLYIGDCEIGGPADDIEANTRRYIEEHADRCFDDDTWTRIALTQEQVDVDPALLALAITKTDKRYKHGRPYQAIECEAVGQVTLEQLLRAKLNELLPEPLESVLARQEEQRAVLTERLEELMP